MFFCHIAYSTTLTADEQFKSDEPGWLSQRLQRGPKEELLTSSPFHAVAELHSVQPTRKNCIKFVRDPH